jgi:hypothetical protein
MSLKDKQGYRATHMLGETEEDMRRRLLEKKREGEYDPCNDCPDDMYN